MRIAVIGADGQLGTDICEAFDQNNDEVCRLGHADIEIASPESVQTVLTGTSPDVVVNTAAFHQVEHCELDATKAFAINACGVRNVAETSARLGAVIVHVSTDYVFDGSKGAPYVEQDSPRPLNVYGNSKLAGEYFVCGASPRHFVLRTSALYGKHPCRAKSGLNFVELMRKLAKDGKELKVVDNEFITPTATIDLAKQIVALSRCDAFGLYHATAEGKCSWYEFAREIFDMTGIEAGLKVASPSDFPSKVRRPKYSVLENAALKSLGMNTFSSWQDGLRRYLTASDREACVA
jgi:dTDP-4-dehydrorhamnose reductase